MSGYLITGARIADPASDREYEADIRIRDELIAEIGVGLEAREDEETIEASGRVVAPALIDLRATACEPGSGAPERLSTTARAAAAGGIGTLVLAPDSGNGLACPEDIELLEARALTLPLRVHAAGLAARGGEICEIGLMLRAGALYVGDGGTPISDSRLVRRILAYAGGFEAWVSLRSEDAFLAANTVAHESDMSVRMGLSTRPGVSERLAATRDAGLVELTGGKLIFDRVTTRECLDAVRAARRRGLEIAATAPVTHLMFNEIDAGNFDARYRLDPPLRAQEDRETLIEALRDGTVDAVVSDHLPVSRVDKSNPFSDAAPGSANLEALLPALLSLVEEGQLSLLEALRPVTSGPADLLGLAQGRIEEGAPADLIVLDPSAPVVYGRAGLVSQGSSAFSGRRLFGKVLMSFVEGAIIVQPDE